jgi:hypothetical protein
MHSYFFLLLLKQLQMHARDDVATMYYMHNSQHCTSKKKQGEVEEDNNK